MTAEPIHDYARAGLPPRRCFVCNKPESADHQLTEIKNPARAFIANEACAIQAGYWSQPLDYDYIPDDLA